MISTSIETPNFHEIPEIFYSSEMSPQLSEAFIGFTGSNDNHLSKIVLSLAWWEGKLGAAYYNSQSHELCVIPDIAGNMWDTSILKGLFCQILPQTLIIKQNLDESLKTQIYQLIGLHPLEPQQSSDGIGYQHTEQSKFGSPNAPIRISDHSEKLNMNCSSHLYVVPTSFYNTTAAIRRLRALRLGTSPPNLTNTERWVYLQSLFPFGYPALLQATGALLKTLEQWSQGQDVDHLTLMRTDAICLNIFSIRITRFDDCIWIDQAGFLSLKIFSQESHPSLFKKGQSQSAKEGLSLFGITPKCQSIPGLLFLKNIFLRPTYNVETLKERYAAIQFCKELSNIELVRGLKLFLRSIYDIKASLFNISTMQCTLNDWKKLLMTVKNLLALSEKCKLLPQSICLFNKLAEPDLSSKWHSVIIIILKMINFKESKRVGRCVVNTGVDENLDKLKQDHDSMYRVYTNVANIEMERLPPFIDQGAIEFFPNIGHCLCIRSWLPYGQQLSAEIVSIPGLELKFYTKENVYYKSHLCYELDDHYGDFGAAIVALEMSVILSGSRAILEHYKALTEGVEMAGYLDAVLSLSALSSEFEMVQPELVENVNGHIHIEEGRHILLQLVAEQFNPNSTYLGGNCNDAKRVHIITGPNSSGKSVYLLQTALIIYLAHIGCFVPAKRLSLTPLKNIFVVRHFPQTVISSLSYFGVELSLMSVALREATNRSLVVIDEFGIGSSYTDGTAIFISCMESWINLNDMSPLLLVATHLHNAVSYFSRHCLAHTIQFSSMGYYLDKEQLVFLYHLLNEKCTKSFPLSVASAAGLPDFVFNRAQEILRRLDCLQNLMPNRLMWNELNCLDQRKLAENFFATPDNSESFKQFLRRNLLGPLRVLST